MEQGCNKKTVIRIMGAYVAWVMGSGFATGQEILQFFTSYGYKSYILLGINLAGFLLIGPAILEAAYAAGFQRFVKVVSLVGPAIIVFTILVGVITVIRDFDGLTAVNLWNKVPEKAIFLPGLQLLPHFCWDCCRLQSL